MFEPKSPQLGPYPIKVEEGKAYFWCACGRSNHQPFCDGSHKGTDFTPLRYVSSKSKTAFFCGCKKSEAKPLCDGTHNKIA